ncbi:MAG: type II secretion system protein [Planctomycetota bacterium]|nr:type II secretion system protein [Planctomycetota bacterium]
MPVKAEVRGFTLIELLIVIAIISILVGLVVVAASSMLLQSKSSKDLANHRTIGAATWSHTIDHNGELLNPRTEPDADNSTQSQIDRFWVRAYDDDFSVRLESDGTEKEESLKDGAAFQYIGSIDAYRSPLDPTNRLRSYSMSAYIGVIDGIDDYVGYNIPGLQEFFFPSLTASQISQPSGTMCTITEDDRRRSANWNGWMLHPREDMPFLRWYDFPAFWMEYGVNISHVDGSTQTVLLSSDALMEGWKQVNESNSDSWNDPQKATLADFKKLRRKLLPGKIGSILDRD